MEGRELRRLRVAHGLTLSQLADMLNVAPDDVEQWEAPKDAPRWQPIDNTTRRQIVRQLALYRDRIERERPARPRAIPAGFSPAHLVPAPIRIK